MTITLFRNRNRRGPRVAVNGNIADLGRTNSDRPGSITMTRGNESILLFKNDDWRGGVHYLQGRNTIDNLGSRNQGGRNTFGNSVRSVRVTPFSADLNITIVKNNAGDLPGNWTSENQVRRDIDRIIADINRWLRQQQALLQFSVARTTFRTDERRFSLRRNQSVPREWKEQREIDVIIPDRFEQDNLLGVAALPHGGQTVRVAAKLNARSGPDVVLTRQFLALVLMHELGHFLGLAHNTSNGDPGNLMFPSGDTNNEDLFDQSITPAQIREMHQRLARNITRRRNRDS